MEILHKVPRIRFMAQRKICYVISALIVLGSLAAEAVNGLNLAVDFTGGVVIEASYSGTADLDRTREALHAAGYPDVRYFTTLFHRRAGLTPAAFRRQRGTRFLQPPPP